MFPKPSRAKKRRPFVDYAAYLGVRIVVCLAQMMSISLAYRVADLLAGLLYRIDRRHRLVALENLEHAFGDQYSSAEREALVFGVYRHILRMIMEMLQIPRLLNVQTWRRYIQLQGHEKVIERLLDDRRPLILLSGHYGNWEMAGYLFGAFGFPPNAVARVLDNPYLERFLRKFRERTGQRMIAKRGGSEQMVEVLQNGGVLSMLADQDAGPKGVFVDFFGRPASTFKAIALLAIEFNAPIVVGGARRIGNQFQFELVMEEIIEPAVDLSPDQVRVLTERYTAALERLIRRDPSQYFWLHRRWKHQPKSKRRPPEQAAA